jgi:predicted permease
VALALSVGIVTAVLSFIVCYWAGKLSGMTQQCGLNTFAVATGLTNYGFIPIPIIESIFPTDQGNQILGVLFVHNLGIETALWTGGIVALSGSLSGAWKRLINPPSVAIAVGLFLNATGIHEYFPEFLTRVIHMVGTCSIPMGLILVGATLLGVIEREKWKTDYRAVGLAVLLRFSVLPLMLIGFALSVGFIGTSPELRTILLIQAAMPCATFPMLLAKHYGGQPTIAMQVCLVTSAASLILTPMLLTGWFWLLETPAV